MEDKKLSQKLRYLIGLLVVIPLVIVLLLGLLVAEMLGLRVSIDKNVLATKTIEIKEPLTAAIWQAPAENTLPQGKQGELIKYGKALISNTSEYLGTQGSVAKISNGMNCQNCHLEGGTKPFGNNYSAVASTYPKFRQRSSSIETIPKRVNDCFERSLNGKVLDTASREMEAIVAYINWLGTGIKKGEKPKGAGLLELAYMDRAAEPAKGKIIYEQKCQSCHRTDGQGMASTDGKSYQYPPLWGKNSYNNGAGLFRLSRFAGYVKANMPLGASYNSPLLTDEEAWDIAAYVNSMPRPDVRKTVMKNDWKNIAGKPIDHPFAPFADDFSEEQHKFGNFKPIVAARKK